MSVGLQLCEIDSRRDRSDRYPGIRTPFNANFRLTEMKSSSQNSRGREFWNYQDVNMKRSFGLFHLGEAPREAALAEVESTGGLYLFGLRQRRLRTVRGPTAPQHLWMRAESL
jgi:hypothetical protein